MSKKLNAVSATSRVAREAAESVIVKGGALAAVVAGAFAAAASHESVILGPIQVLAGGGGVGLFAWDGRVRQPGKGVARPRGFLPEDQIPESARIGSPASVAALLAVLAHAGTISLGKATAPAIAIVGKKEPRGEFFARLRDRGPRVFLDSADPLLAIAGRLAGGVLTREDLADIEIKVVRAASTRDGALKIARAPWDEGAPNGCIIHSITATDRAGSVAVLSYEEHTRGIAVPELGLFAPFYAEPVVRGVTRIRPGTPLLSRAPMALLSFGRDGEAAIAARPGIDAETALAAVVAASVEAGALMGAGDSVIGVVHSARTATSLTAE